MKTIFKVFLSVSILVLGSGCSTMHSKYSNPNRKLPGELNEITVSESSKLDCKPSEELNETDISDHFIFIDSNGDMRDENYTKIKKECAKIKIDRILERFDLWRNDPSRSNKENLKMTIFIHGGLNRVKHAAKRVKATSERILRNNQYPVFISWRASYWTNYRDRLLTMRNGERYTFEPSESPIESFGAIGSAPFVLAEDILRSIARIPTSYWNMIARKNALALRFSNKEKRAAEKSEENLEGSEFRIHGCLSSKDDIPGSIIANPAKLITTPLADGLGKGAWRSMLRRTDLILNSQAAFDGEEKKDSETAVHYFMSRLKEKKSVKKVLIGHSMGTIIANNILSRFPDIGFDAVVYMAAACKLKDLEKSVVPWLRRHKKGELYNLTLNPYSDISESKYWGSIPGGSLLIWIDEFLEDVNSFLDRTAGYWFNLVRAAKIIFPQELRSRVHLTKFDIDHKYRTEGRGYPKVPQTHGAFDDYNFWDKSFWEGDESGIIYYRAP